MTVLYLINNKEYNYHMDLKECFADIIPGEVFDVSDEEYRGRRFNEIEAKNADVIITFDGSGLELRTTTDSLSLNNIYARFAHILFHKPSYYGQLLGKRQNLSMFTYVPEGTDVIELGQQFPEIPNLFEFGEFYYKPQSDHEKDVNRKTVESWWEEFKKEAMIRGE